METKITRRDIAYSIISRFEEMLREIILRKSLVFFPDFYDAIPIGILEKTKSRANELDLEEPLDFLENTDFPDLKEIICYKNMFGNYFPNEKENFKMQDFQKNMKELYELRCKIAHVRGYFNSIDLDKLIDCTKNIAAFIDDGKNFLSFIEELYTNPEKVIVSIPIDFISECQVWDKIPNNIPTPDYEYEGGFVGREDDIKSIYKLLDGDLHRIITISGAGGVGKTSLALKVISKFITQSNKKFDGIVWLSAKENKLSYLGIEDIEPTIKNYEQLLDTICDVMGFPSSTFTLEEKESDVDTIFNMHNCILIVIDNLETITDERIINFILDAHPKIKVLITSRRGLGQVERRYDLKQLKEKDAIHLFRQISRDKGLKKLASLNDDIIGNYVKKVAYYPLAIKWVIGHVALGKDIHSIIDSINETTSDISSFCFDYIYRGLSESAKKIICALSYFNEPPTAGVLKYVVNREQKDFEDGIQELVLVSLVIPEQFKNEQNELSTRYSLLLLTHGYVRQQLDKDSLFKRDIEERLRTVQLTIEEAARAEKQYRFSLFNLGATTEEEKVAAMLAQTAFQKYQAGGYFEAVEDYKRAAGIAPRFVSIYRNWAVMESLEGHFVEADQLMQKATQINPKDTQLWITWGNLKRKCDKIKDSLDYYKRAYELSPDDHIVLNSLGQAKARLGNYSEANKLFRQALQKESLEASTRHQIINLSSLADNLCRWSEGLIKDRNYNEAEKKLIEAFDVVKKVVELDKNDSKSAALYRHISINLGYFYKYQRQENKAIEYFENAIVTNPKKYKEVKDSIIASLQVSKIHYKLNNIEKSKQILLPIKHKFKETLKSDIKILDEFNIFYNELFAEKHHVEGRIIRVNLEKNFVIIESLISAGNTFLGHYSNFSDQIESLSNDFVGKRVLFFPEEYQSYRGIKKQAKQVKFINNEVS